MRRFVLGLDLGKHADYAALVALAVGDERPRYQVPAVKRWPLGTPYPTVLEDVRRLASGPGLAGAPVTLAIDGTGVGSVVWDLLRSDPPAAALVSVIITSGRLARPDPVDPRVWRVPKSHLVAAVQSALGTDNLRVARSLPEAGTLAGELRDFEVRLSRRGRDTWSARTGKHDDVVLALAVALWVAAMGVGGTGSAAVGAREVFI